MKVALKPCPFCGGEAVALVTRPGDVGCDECGSFAALSTWNRRVVDPALATFAATLKHAEARAEKAEQTLRVVRSHLATALAIVDAPTTTEGGAK